MTPSLIGIAGGTGAGKSSIVRALVERLGGVVIDLDSYYLDRGDLPPEERRRINYDEPAAIDARLLVEHLGRLAQGQPIHKPVYDFTTHSRVAVASIAPARLVIVEGLFTLWWATLRSLLDLRVFVDAPSDLRLVRRIRRDVAERGRTADEVLQQYVATVRPMYERYVDPTRVYADLVVTNDGPLRHAVEPVIASLRTRKANGLAAVTPAR